ncbi:MAG: helix-turn-helix transcriptional regulator [Treponema sp.]|nr:helix-turn-helix transcriptional regulator [Treponema sp.]MEE3434322.1 helix-turn-helix transcriptional regulator [Treponema sp.]
MELEELNLIYTSNLKEKRKERGLKQHDLAEKAGLSEKFLSDIESGRRWGKYDTLVAIANALEIEPFELLLPPGKSVNYNSQKTRSLMKQVRTNISALLDTVETFLGEK